jgi:hypothetical protein
METVVRRKQDVVLQKGEDQMKTMIQQKTTIRPQPEEIAVRQQDSEEKVEITPQPQEVPQETSKEVTPSMGLCATCNEAPDCAYAQQATTPVLFCEMFDASESPEQTSTDEREPDPQIATAAAQPSELKGLCVNCDNRHSCVFPKPEEGIWHCEEYR